MRLLAPPVRTIAAVLAAVGALVWLAGAAGAEETRVEPGDDLASAVAGLAAGDTLVLAPGVHRLDVDLEVNTRGGPGRPITLRGEGGRESVAIAGTGRLRLSAASRWAIEGVTFRSVPLLLDSDDELGHPFDTRIVDNRFVGWGVELRNAGSVEIAGNHFANVRSMRPGEDRHAIQLLGTSGDLVIRGNLVTDAGADAIHAPGRVRNVLVEGNELRIDRPRPADDRFCNTGENAIDVRDGERWVIRDNHVHGYHVVPGCEAFDSATRGGDAVVIHDHGARDVEITGNRFEDNTVHVLVVGRTCDDGGGCADGVRTERVEVRRNEFRSGGIPGRATGVRITPGSGTARLDPPIAPLGVTVADNTFVGLDIVVDVVARSFATAGGDVLTRPGEVVVERNDHLGGRMKLAAEARVTERDNTTTRTDATPTTDTPAATTAPAATTVPAATTPRPTSTAAAPVTTIAARAATNGAPPTEAGATPGDDPVAASTPGRPAEPDVEPELGDDAFPWPWLAGTAVLIVGAAIGLAAWRARRHPHGPVDGERSGPPAG